MIPMATLTTFLGWCTVINIGIIFLFMLTMTIVGKDGLFIRFSMRVFGNTQEDTLATLFRVFMQYRLLFAMFNLVPYVALKIMAPS